MNTKPSFFLAFMFCVDWPGNCLNALPSETCAAFEKVEHNWRKEMSATKTSVGSIYQRINEIQASWTHDERRRRAKEGQKRCEQLLSYLLYGNEPEIWAVGAPVVEDSQRIAG
jgi:hypothetical protein